MVGEPATGGDCRRAAEEGRISDRPAAGHSTAAPCSGEKADALRQAGHAACTAGVAEDLTSAKSNKQRFERRDPNACAERRIVHAQ